MSSKNNSRQTNRAQSRKEPTSRHTPKSGKSQTSRHILKVTSSVAGLDVDARATSKSGNKKINLTKKFDLPPTVYDGSCEAPGEHEPHYYKLAEEKPDSKALVALATASLIDAPGTAIRQLASSYWKLLLGPTQFIYWDANSKYKCPSSPSKKGKWIFIDTARDILEGQSPPTQCNNVIGNNEYLTPGEYGEWYNYVFKKTVDFSKLYTHFTTRPSAPNSGFVKFRKKCCWICGFPLYPEGIGMPGSDTKKSTKPPCEHILPVINAIFNLKLYQKQDNSFTKIHQQLIKNYPNHEPLQSFSEAEIRSMTPPLASTDAQDYIDHIPQLNLLLKEYAWSHTCCNSIKSDYNLITTDKSRNGIYSLIPNQTKIEQLLDEIWGSCFNENIAFLNAHYEENIASRQVTFGKWKTARVDNMSSVFLDPICKYANEIYSKVPLLYNLASIASIIEAVPIELRNLLLFSNISQDKLEDEKVIKLISLNDIKADHIVKFKPVEENVNVVYSVANKIATIIQKNCITGQLARQSERLSKPTASVEEYIDFLNALFPTLDSNLLFTDAIILNVLLEQDKKNIPEYNKIIAIYIYKNINSDIYNFYKLMFMYLVLLTKPKNPTNFKSIQQLSTSTYYILLYQFLLKRVEGFITINPSLSKKPAIVNLYQNIIDICNKFKKNETENVIDLLKNITPSESREAFWVIYDNLWPESVSKVAIIEGRTPRVESDKFTQRNKTKMLEQFKAKFKTLPASEPVDPAAILARGWSTSATPLSAPASASASASDALPDALPDAPPPALSAPAPLSAPSAPAPDLDDPQKITLVSTETSKFKSDLDMLVEELEKYNNFPTTPLKVPTPSLKAPTPSLKAPTPPPKVPTTPLTLTTSSNQPTRKRSQGQTSTSFNTPPRKRSRDQMSKGGGGRKSRKKPKKRYTLKRKNCNK